MKQKLLYISCAWLVLMLTGCVMDDYRDRPDEGCVQVEVLFRQRPMKSAPRAVEGGDIIEETKIQTLYLFAEQGGVLTPFKFDYGAAGITSGLIVERINLAAGSYHFYAVANSTKDLSSITSLADLKAEVLSVQPNPVQLVMTGDIGPLDVAVEKKIPIRLNRVAARIDIKNESPAFTFESVTLCGVPNQSNLFFKQAAGKEEGWPALPATAIRSDIDEQIVTGNMLSGKLYCYESASVNATASAEQVCLIVKGSYRGRSGYYRIDLMDFRGRRWVRRNTRYNMTIQKVTGYGYETFEQAKANKPVNMQLGVNSFEGYENAQVMVYDGEYYLSCSLDSLIANQDSSLPWKNSLGEEQPPMIPPYEFYVKTNAPKINAFDPEEWKGEMIPQYPDNTDSWMTLERDATDNNKVIVNVGFRPMYTEEEMVAPTYKMIYRVTVPGRPNLHLDIPIWQTAVAAFYDDFEISQNFFRTNGGDDEIFTCDVVVNFDQSIWYVKEIIQSPASGWLIETTPSLGDGRYGSGSFSIISHKLPEGVNYGEALIVLESVPAVPSSHPKRHTIRIVSGLTIDYDIEYPTGIPYYADLNRTKYVMETPLNQTSTARFKVNVRSTQHWRVEAHQDWIAVTQPIFSGGNYNTSFYVDVPVNPGMPIISGLKKAREGKVRILGDQASLDIVVYQGGYVQIGDDIWMDRNLKRSRYNEIFSYYGYDTRRRDLNGNLIENSYADLYIAKLIESGTIDELLYPAAIPWAFPADMTACYNKHRDATFNQQLAGGSRLIPDIGYLIGDYYFLQFGYGRTNHVQLPPNNDGYFSWGQPVPLSVGNSSAESFTGTGKLPTAWNSQFNVNHPIMNYPTTKTRLDPCPNGWRVPTYAELNKLLSHLSSAKHYSSGIKDLSFPKHSDDMNNGLYFYNADKVSCWFPFTGHRYERSIHRWQGKKTGYCINGLNDDRLNTFHLAFGFNINDDTGEILSAGHIAAMIQDRARSGFPIRCIRDI